MRRDWDERYREADWAYGREPNDFLVEVTDRLPRGRALCLAEGQGRNAVHLARCGLEVTAMDQSAAGLARARELAAARGVSIETAESDLDGFRIEEGAWDVIVAFWAHLLPDLRGRVHAAAVGGLRRGGAFVLEAYTPAQVGRGTGGPQEPERTMTAAGLRVELAGLDFEVLREVEREVVEGTYHSGLSSVVQVLGVRS